MGTRADFYVGIDRDAEWIGSIAWDGDNPPIGDPTTEAEFRATVEEILTRPDATRPSYGWPWPWADSSLTDVAWAFADGGVLSNTFGRGWRASGADEGVHAHPTDFPDMTSLQNVTTGPRSGLITLR